ncbi:MAG: haloacid dehalogenase-like hydrolase [Candidatus Eremiobacteraeota bacterium]|nr:haloacid dehalogenase-like hydrolase [Candidatus Eremiobacteraeota bacterium]
MLVRESADLDEWERLERHLHSRTMSLREVLAAQAALIRCSLSEADELLAGATTFDTTFARFVKRCAQDRVALTVLSSGIGPLIERAFERNGLYRIALLANGVTPDSTGWQMNFRDGSDNGHDKARAVKFAQHIGNTVAYIGDGYSDFDAALAADIRFAKRGRSLERHLIALREPFTPFDRFSEIEAQLFPEPLRQ